MPLLKLMKSGRPVLGERSGNSDNKKLLPKGAKLVALPVEKVLSEPIDLTCAPCEDPSIGHVRIEDDEEDASIRSSTTSSQLPRLSEAKAAPPPAAPPPTQSNNDRLVRTVRLPCSTCDHVLPAFTVSWDRAVGGVAVRIVTCGSCGSEQKVKIKPSFDRPPVEDDEAEVDRTHAGYKTSGVASLDWVKNDPSKALAV